MPRQKTNRFQSIEHFGNVIQIDSKIKNHTKIDLQKHFGNNNPIVLELGCGKGEYTTSLATKFPEKNFVGIDIKGDRIWVGANTAITQNLKNVLFVRTQIELIDQIFQNNSINEIWITFCDPQPNKPSKRLTYPRYLEMYASLLEPNGNINLKTDSDLLLVSTLMVLELTKITTSFQEIIDQITASSTTLKSFPEPNSTNGITESQLQFLTRSTILVESITNDLYNSEFQNVHHGIKTFFENKHTNLGQTIKYLRFSITNS